MSQFIEMFGNYETNANFGDLFSSARNGANIKQGTISGGIPITRIETISEGEINRDKMGYAGIVDNTYSSYYLQDGDILVSHINSMKHIGKCALYQRINDETIIHGMNLLCLRPYKDIVNPQYVTYLLRSSIMRKLILDITKPAVNQASFTVKDLCKLKVMLPPISEQEEFVAIVKQADKSEFVGFKSQFIEMFGNYETNANFGDLFSSARNGANIKQGTISGGIPITRIETISEGEINRDKMGYAGIVDNTYSSYYLQDGDILVSHINSMKHIGKCALYQRINDETIIHGMNLLCLRPYKDIVNPQYVTYLLRSSIMRKLILDITKPAVNQASFTVKDLCKLKVMLPPISEQEEFVAIVKQADKSEYYN